MKKITSIVVLGTFGLLFLISCAKEYKCECAASEYSAALTTTVYGKKKDAKTKCEKNPYKIQSGTICKLK